MTGGTCAASRLGPAARAAVRQGGLIASPARKSPLPIAQPQRSSSLASSGRRKLWELEAIPTTSAVSADDMPASSRLRLWRAPSAQPVHSRTSSRPGIWPRPRTRRSCGSTLSHSDAGHRSFSASSRNSSGTVRESSNATDPYPTACHPKRSRILSTARSAIQRVMPNLVPGRRR